MRIAVTGGAGFIGSNLVRELARENDVVVLDDLSTGRIQNISALVDLGKVQVLKGSILDEPLLNKAFRGIDYVFHLAALVSVSESIKDPHSTNEVNIGGTLKVLIAARDNGVKKVIFSSSSAIYGDSPMQPKTEDMLPIPLSPYAISKLTGEYYCEVFHRIYHLPTVCLRYFNIYGPLQDPNSEYAAVIPRFISLVHEGRAPVIFGDGEQTRDFTFVADAVQANIKAAEANVSGNFNIGTGRRTSINELARAIIKIMGKSIQPIYESARAGDILESMADIRKAQSLGYRPRFDLLPGLEQTINWFEQTR